jgi:hypothetical protein
MSSDPRWDPPLAGGAGPTSGRSGAVVTAGYDLTSGA